MQSPTAAATRVLSLLNTALRTVKHEDTPLPVELVRDGGNNDNCFSVVGEMAGVTTIGNVAANSPLRPYNCLYQ